MAVAAEDADATLTAGTGAGNKAAEAEVEGGPKAENATVAAADDPVPNGNDFAAASGTTCAATCAALKLASSTAGEAEEEKEKADADEAAATQVALEVCWDAPAASAAKPVSNCCAAPGSAAAKAPVPANPNPKFRDAKP